MDAYIKFLYSVNEKDWKTATQIRNDIKLNKFIYEGTDEGEAWAAFDTITSNNRKYKSFKRFLGENSLPTG